MPRKSKTNGHETAPAEKPNAAKVRAALGTNIAPEVLKKHYAAVGALKAKIRALQDDLSAAWRAAEADGIDKKAGKLVFGLFDLDPATADQFLRHVQTYSTQLGLFDKIDSFKAEEEREANAGSVARAESDLKRPQNSDTSEPTNGAPRMRSTRKAIRPDSAMRRARTATTASTPRPGSAAITSAR